MRATANSHAALSGSGYPLGVYCNGVSGLSTSCAGNFEVVAKLSGSANAHVRQGDQPDGTDGIHYLPSQYACISVPTGGNIVVGYQANNCNGFDTTLFSMNKTPTNSHVGESSAYTNKVCATGSMPSGGSVLLPSSNPPAPITPPVTPLTPDPISVPETDGRNIIDRVLGINRPVSALPNTNSVDDDIQVAGVSDNTDEVFGIQNSGFPGGTVNEDVAENTVAPVVSNTRNIFSAASIFGNNGFLPESPLGWAAAGVLLAVIFLLGRRLVKNKLRVGKNASV